MQVLSDDFLERMMDEVTSKTEKTLREIEKKYAIRSKYLSKTNACIYADISAPTLDNWLAMGLPIAKIGGVFRISTEDLDSFIEKHLMK